jgi:hypothetical protein
MTPRPTLTEEDRYDIHDWQRPRPLPMTINAGDEYDEWKPATRAEARQFWVVVGACCFVFCLLLASPWIAAWLRRVWG